MKFAQMSALPQQLSHFDTGKEKSQSCTRPQRKDQAANLSDAQINALILMDRSLPSLKASEVLVTDTSQLPRMIIAAQQANVIDGEIVKGYKPTPSTQEIE